MSTSFEEIRETTTKFFAEGQVNSPANGMQPVFAVVGYNDIRTLEGKLLTLVDASFSDVQQRKAFKDLIRQNIWWQWAPSLDQGPNVPHAGMPVAD